MAISLYVVAALAVTAAGLLIAPESASQATGVPPATDRAEIGK
ncbi:hypothetical protein [Planomonospora parontospora]|nr:hypothetical protein [Planomonospora parontospora]GGL13782.1 hypothetical protein GCM10014719_14650 [Planomonospora parontospora subsp. antibiotica]GII13874.1 hypothetical protein Ppa05_06000 [Planomonospora parontospora subsp. antibiotica]